MVERHINDDGYVTVKDTKGIYGKKNAWVPEHRLVMSEFLGFKVPKNAHVHHINGNKTDNRVENLAVVSNVGHSHIHQIMPQRTIVEKECCDPNFYGKEQWLKIRCPQCGKIFFRKLSQSSLKVKKRADCCSCKCAQELGDRIEKDGVTFEIRNAIDTSVICQFSANGKFMSNFISHRPKGFEINDHGLYVRTCYHQGE